MVRLNVGETMAIVLSTLLLAVSLTLSGLVITASTRPAPSACPCRSAGPTCGCGHNACVPGTCWGETPTKSAPTNAVAPANAAQENVARVRS